MKTPGQEDTYKLAHATYITSYHDWETQLQYYPEFTHFRPSQLVLQFVRGLLHELLPRILSIENMLLCHQASHHFHIVEPDMPSGCDLADLHEVLMAAVRSLDLAGQHSTPTTATIGSIIQTPEKYLSEDPEEYMDYFAHFCDTNVDTDGPSFNVCVLAIQ